MCFAYYCVNISESNSSINSLSFNPVFTFPVACTRPTRQATGPGGP